MTSHLQLEASHRLPPIYPPSLYPELRAQPTGKGSWERRLRKDVERALPYLEDALKVVLKRWRGLLMSRPCPACARPRAHPAHASLGDCRGLDDTEALLGELTDHGAMTLVRRALAEGRAMIERGDDRQRALEAQHARLLSVMAEEGLDLGLACSKLGLYRPLIEKRMTDDPFFGEQVRRAFDQGTIALLGPLARKARAGGERAAMHLLALRDPDRFAPIQRHQDVGEKEIRKSPAWAGLVARLLEAVAPGHECATCGGCRCRERLEELR